MNKPLHKTITKRLREMILSDDYSVDDRLPTEPVLAKNLGVSRATLREALNQLEGEGLIYRLHGLGTFIKSKHPAISLNLTIPRSITEMLNNLGLLPGTKSMEVSTIPLIIGSMISLIINSRNLRKNFQSMPPGGTISDPPKEIM